VSHDVASAIVVFVFSGVAFVFGFVFGFYAGNDRTPR